MRRPGATHGPGTAGRRPRLIDLDQRIRTLAPTTVRSLHAIHLGTALHSRSSLTSFVTYDKRLLDAAQAAGLPIDSPA